jgi:Calcineurin-like phosphoesterase
MRKFLKYLLFTAVLFATISSMGCSTIEGVKNNDLWHHENELNREDYPSMVLPSDRDFKILVLADIQLESLPHKDSKALKTVREMVEKTKPDLILTVGDNTSWKFDHKLTPRLIKTFEEFEIPWAVTLGNHDAEGRADRYWIGNLYENAENSLFKSGPSNIHGVGNSAIQLVDNEGELQQLLVLIDSNASRVHPQGETYDYIYYDQIQWYRWLIEGFAEVPSLAFFHIPLVEFKEAVVEYNEGKVSDKEVFGENREDVFCAHLNSGLFDVMKELGSTTHIFNGHDHVNNMSIPFEGIRMTYVLKTGPGSYSDKDMRGGTLVTIARETNEISITHIFSDL